MGKAQNAVSDDLKPPADDQRRHSYSGEENERVGGIAGSSSNPGLSKQKPEKRGLFGKLKDKAIGTKEEREAEKRRDAEVVQGLFIVLKNGADLNFFSSCDDFVSCNVNSRLPCSSNSTLLTSSKCIPPRKALHMVVMVAVVDVWEAVQYVLFRLL